MMARFKLEGCTYRFTSSLLEKLVYSKIKFNEEKKIILDPAQIIDVGKEILQKRRVEFSLRKPRSN